MEHIPLIVAAIYGYGSWVIAALARQENTISRFILSIITTVITVGISYFGLRMSGSPANLLKNNVTDIPKYYVLLLPSVLTQIYATASTLWLLYVNQHYPKLATAANILLPLVIFVPLAVNITRNRANWLWYLLQWIVGVVIGVVAGLLMEYFDTKEEVSKPATTTTTTRYKYIAVGLSMIAVIGIFFYLFKEY